MLRKRWVSLDSFGYGWDFQLELLPKWLQAKFADTTNWTLIRSTGLTSSLNTTLYQLTSNNLWAPVLLEWYSRFDDISVQSSPLQKVRLLTATSMLRFVPNQGFNHARGSWAYQAFLYFFKTIASTARLYLQNSWLSHSCVGFIIYFEPSQLTKISTKLEDLSVPRYWNIMLLTLLMFLKSLQRSLNNQPERRTLQLKSSYRWPTHDDWSVQTQVLLPTLPPGMEWWTRLLRHSIGRNSVRWFNLAPTRCIKSGKPTGFVFSAIHKLFWDIHWVH